ncbi:MAG: Flp family type IVb pilin [Acidimicrobiia bacterium]|nr:Flp family type IVb pilin [Acidimicrobiia bacterium]
MKGEQVLSQITSFVGYFRAKMSSDEGATMVEYGIMVALIAVVSIIVIGALGVDVFAAFNTAQNEISSTPGPFPATSN